MIYGYIRVSTDRQAEDGQSLGTQQRVIQGYAMQQGWTVDEIFVERSVSGSVPLTDRPQGQLLLAALQSGDIVITPKLDRMFRSALNALEVLQQLQAQGVSLHMIDLGGDVTGNGVSKLVFTILSAVAEAERDRIRERIRDVKRDQAKRGRYLGGKVPFGWRVEDGALVKEPTEQQAIALIHEERAGAAPLRAIAAKVHERFGVSLSHVAVSDILKRAS